ncbi:hypothetical protein EPUS_01745 [Endocarpon pusillum Z07020]|uniref:WLM domain-containing protein n=1 Tax=Endocarpon pusillum (strain Z07020 / HMAS-L-300199) TaxID=1263415 RepID=U1HNA2_ENDPU|nr:uncharacterized protein EPUS_01745 [Endocarpon pusillum Z07020]ERF71830.1 hypothetical protein EPUS_01745 [Endocarpon pusillum Z07020]
MKRHHLSITTLEEHEPNREFIGRNFNNGEVIQLVLQRRDGSWMSFRQVQMVMMHELAHNVQMNHGRAFWAERNRFAAEMKGLWERGYTGEGFWGAGRVVDGLRRHEGNLVDVGEGREVEGLCGGTYRSRRGRKRKREGEVLAWKEQKERRIEKKFGKNGVALGEDEDARIKLEIGRRGTVGGKPRVAGSKRGRELRAAAALARFEVGKEEEKMKSEKEEEKEDPAEYDSGTDEDGTPSGKDAVDANGNRLLDSMGFGMIKVCGDEDVDDVNVKQEMEDFDSLQCLPSYTEQQPRFPSEPSETAFRRTESPPAKSVPTPALNSLDSSKIDRQRKLLYSIPHHQPSPPPSPPRSTSSAILPEKSTAAAAKPAPSSSSSSLPPPITTHSTTNCPVCTTSHPSTNLTLTCTTCAHVLDKRKDPHAWKCASTSCKGSEYVNAGDAGRCGACGDPKG